MRWTSTHLITHRQTSKSYSAKLISNSDRTIIKTTLCSLGKQMSSSQSPAEPLNLDYSINPIHAILHGGVSWGTSSGLVISTLPLFFCCMPSPLLLYVPFPLAAELCTFSQVIYSKERIQRTQSSQPLCLRLVDIFSVCRVCELDRQMVKSSCGRNIQIQIWRCKNTPLLQH